PETPLPLARTPPVVAASRPTARPATAKRRAPTRPPAPDLARDMAVVLIRSSSNGLASGRSSRRRWATPSISSLCASCLRLMFVSWPPESVGGILPLTTDTNERPVFRHACSRLQAPAGGISRGHGVRPPRAGG